MNGFDAVQLQSVSDCCQLSEECCNRDLLVISADGSALPALTALRKHAES